MKKILICGLGSIGQRHVRVIREVLGNDVEVAAYRSRNLDIIISDSLDATFDEKPEDYYGIRCFYDYAQALLWKPDAVFVTNPISMHVDTALLAAKSGANIFIEKPLSHNMQGVSELQKVVKQNDSVCMLGYQLRYHPAYLRIKELLDQNVLGKVMFADLHFGEWLPGMHPYEDYRISHAARSDQGGGAILCLSHEIDIAYWLFGKPDKINAVGGLLSDLEMDVEDCVDLSLMFNDEVSPFSVHVHLDFLQKPARRYVHIVCDNGAVSFDYITNVLNINFYDESKNQTVHYDQFERNDMFRNEVNDFIESIQKNSSSPISLEQGVDVLDICMAAKESLSTGKIVEM